MANFDLAHGQTFSDSHAAAEGYFSAGLLRSKEFYRALNIFLRLSIEFSGYKIYSRTY